MTDSATHSSFPFGKVEVTEGGQSSDISLNKVDISGDVSGLFFSYHITQTYKNTARKNLEIIYTFPLAWNTVLLGIEAVIGGVRRVGKVVEKTEAEEKYEKAIEKGDTAIMVEKAPHGLYTANLGNIRSGETVAMTIMCANLLSFEKDRVRLAIPTVISERYGDPHAQGGLAPHESAAVDPSASYGFSLRIALHGAIAKSDVSSPSHDITAAAIEDGIQYEIRGAAFLDRDFILLCENIPSRSLAQYVRNADEYLMVASFAPQIPDAKESAVAVKILIDCSGSMSGERITQAKKGLRAMLGHLSPADYVSYSRFGSNVCRDIQKTLPADDTAQHLLRNLVNQTEASLGGTELRNALSDTCAISTPKNMPPLIFLITDGDVWNIDEILQLAKSSEHRIFAIGVGAAPSESLLREMAEQTGGACEFVSSEENMAEAVVRMFRRMRGSIVRNVTVTWPDEPIWSSKTPAFLYDGETIHCFARFTRRPTGLPELSFFAESAECTAKPDELEETSDGNVFRLGKYFEMLETEDKDRRTEIAVTFQFVTDSTSLLLIHERDTKLQGLPTVQNVPQMPTKGHGCFFPFPFAMALCVPSFLSQTARFASPMHPPAQDCCTEESGALDDVFDNGSENAPIQEDVQKDIQLEGLSPALLAHLVDLWKATLPSTLSSSTTLEECLKHIMRDERFADIRDVLLREQSSTGLPCEDLLAILLQCLIEQGKADCSDRHTKRILTARLSVLDAALVESVKNTYRTFIGCTG